MSVTYDQISELSDEEQEQFHRNTQKHLRKLWAKARQQTECEQDEIDKRRPQ